MLELAVVLGLVRYQYEMDVRRICFLATRTGRFDTTAAFFRDVLGLHDAHAEPGWAVFQLPSGQRDYVEVYGPEKQNASFFPTEIEDGIVVAFAVGDIVAAREELAAAEVELIGDLVWAGDGYGWFFFRGPDRNIYVIQQDSHAVEA